MIVGQQKGHDLKERQFRNFGMPRPEGYRKAQRLALLAQKFHMPVVTLVDTPGAFPGVDAEEGRAGGRHRAHSAGVRRPLGAHGGCGHRRGRFGGRLALALCDRVYMLENAIYSVITPEGCSAILWRDAAEAAPGGRGATPDRARPLPAWGDRPGDTGAPQGRAQAPPGHGEGGRRARCRRESGSSRRLTRRAAARSGGASF